MAGNQNNGEQPKRKDVLEEAGFLDLLDEDVASSILASDMVAHEDDGLLHNSSFSPSASCYTVEEASLIVKFSPRRESADEEEERRVTPGTSKEDILVETANTSASSSGGRGSLNDTMLSGSSRQSSSSREAEASPLPRKVFKIFSKFNLLGVGPKVVAEAAVKGRPIKIKACRQSEIQDVINVTDNLKQKLTRELEQVYYLNNKKQPAYNDKMRKETRVRRAPKANTKMATLVSNMFVLAWLVMEIDDEQQILFETVDILDDDPGAATVTLRCSEATEGTPVSTQTPLLRPLPGDCKFGRFGLRTAVHMRDFIFKTTEVRAEWRIELCRELEQQDFVTLVNEPLNTFQNFIRYTQMTGPEFINYMYHTEDDGKQRQPKCPCGLVAKVTSLGILQHSTSCGFQDFVKLRLPTLIKGNLISTQALKVLTENETAYLRKVREKRKPVRKEVQDSRGKVIVEVNNDGTEKVIKITPYTEEEKHRRACQARTGCSRCNQRKT